MAIEVLFHGILKQYFENDVDGENGLLYSSNTSMNIGELIDYLGIHSRSIAFVVINQKKYTINNALLDMYLNDGDCIEIFPNILGG